jgi:hypothetical protein
MVIAPEKVKFAGPCMLLTPAVVIGSVPGLVTMTRSSTVASTETLGSLKTLLPTSCQVVPPSVETSLLIETAAVPTVTVAVPVAESTPLVTVKGKVSVPLVSEGGGVLVNQPPALKSTLPPWEVASAVAPSTLKVSPDGPLAPVRRFGVVRLKVSPARAV